MPLTERLKVLSPQQRRIARELAHDPTLTYAEIGEKLGISTHNVKWHSHVAQAKLGYSSKLEMGRALRLEGETRGR